MVADYDNIRNAIEAVIPEFYKFNERIKQPGDFIYRMPLRHDVG